LKGKIKNLIFLWRCRCKINIWGAKYNRQRSNKNPYFLWMLITLLLQSFSLVKKKNKKLDMNI